MVIIEVSGMPRTVQTTSVIPALGVSAACDARGERLAVEELHDQVGLAGRQKAHIEDLRDPGVLDLADRDGLVEETLHLLLSAEMCGSRVLIATRVLMSLCCASQTWPMPPWPSARVTSKSPIVVPITTSHLARTPS
jgi:hypothetical protein